MADSNVHLPRGRSARVQLEPMRCACHAYLHSSSSRRSYDDAPHAMRDAAMPAQACVFLLVGSYIIGDQPDEPTTATGPLIHAASGTTLTCD